ncbi:MAG: Gfo/Idh/MocA family oxidoreductase [Verrucomicrobia bacterium]|nr:Gfo/Idh/MocA family oxidoreductase [Verrucomicrobiota bacterium]
MNFTSASNPAIQHNRRAFIKSASAAVAGGAALAALPIERFAHAAGSDTLKAAIVGCGGRGTGAVNQNLNVHKGTKLVAMADISRERMDLSFNTLKKQHPDQVDVSMGNQFLGFDAYKEAIALADLVFVTTPQGFHPYHFAEAVRQGKHVFMEKPLAVDAPGVRTVLAASEEAKKKNLKVGVGLQRHHQVAYQEIVKRIHDGAIGDITSLSCYWRGNARAGLERLPGEGELQYQLRNWYYFTWISGDFIVDQHIHNLDIMNWVKRGHPVRAQGMGGRQVRNSNKLHGQIFDHFFVEYEYEDGCKLYSQCRQGQAGTHTVVSEHAVGTKGAADLGLRNATHFRITGQNPWESRLKKGEDGHQLEHYPLIAAIRENKPYNEVEPAAMSTMTAILGRMAVYSGKLVEWDDAFNSKLQLMPSKVSWDMEPPVKPDADGNYPVAVPGKTVAL